MLSVLILSSAPLIAQSQQTGDSTNHFHLLEASAQQISSLVNTKKVRVVKRIDELHYIVHGNKSLLPGTAGITKLKKPANNDWKLEDGLMDKITTSSQVYVAGLEADRLHAYLSERFDSGAYTLLSAKGNLVRLETDNVDVVEHLKLHDSVYYIGMASFEVREESVLSGHDLAYNKVNKVHSDFPLINGAGFTVSIKEQLFVADDIDLIGRNKASGIEHPETSGHATDMGTIIGGAGNSFLLGKGAAWACTFTSSSFENTMPDDDDVFTLLNISVQNHSYGTAFPDYRYGAEAAAYDANTNSHPGLLHVFSAGNLGLIVNDEGPYANVARYANLSGNFKMAKNTLVVGAVDEYGNVDERNSAGPAYDGRVKPELVAYGKNGTSESAAMVSGIALLAQQKYKQDFGVVPGASFIKAALIAGAEDVGAPGLDFITGYGNANASRTIAIIDSEQFLAGELANAENIDLTISVPAGVKTLRVVLAWNDAPANAGDAVALVNDLDMVLTSPSSTIYLPWVLDHTPDVELLAKPATRKEDHLNNVELITVENPQEGSYRVNVSANLLSGADQIFDIAYFFEYENELGWTYPSAGDILIAEDSAILRWETTIDESVSVEININDTGWQQLVQDVELNSKGHMVKTPDVLGRAKLRMVTSAGSFQSEEFLIAPLVDYSVGYNCDQDFLLEWRQVEGAERYNVYKLGSQYMALVQQTTDTAMVFDKNEFDEDFFTISPVWNGYEGNRSLSYNYQNQGVGCFYRNFFASNVSNQYVSLLVNLTTTYSVDSVVFERSVDGVLFEPIHTSLPENLQLAYEHNDFEPNGEFVFYRAIIFVDNAVPIITDELEVFFPMEQTMIIYPNPVEQLDFFSLLSKEGENGTLEMMDLSGKLLRKWEVNGNDIYFEVPYEAQKGIYLVRLKRDGRVIGAQRIMVY